MSLNRSVKDTLETVRTDASTEKEIAGKISPPKKLKSFNIVFKCSS